MSESKFKTMRHIETVRNYLNLIIFELINKKYTVTPENPTLVDLLIDESFGVYDMNDLIIELLRRGERHDQSKLQPPEVEIFEEYTPKLRGITYGSDEYKQCLKEIKPAVDHHNEVNRHHPEHFFNYNCNGCHKDFPGTMPDACDVCGYSQFQKESDINQMNLIDLIEMICDWKAAGMRHHDGDLLESIQINKKRFRISDQLEKILINTAEWINRSDVYHKADES